MAQIGKNAGIDTISAFRRACLREASLRQASLAALVAFLVLAPLIGFRTDVGLSGALELFPRPGLLALLVGAVFVLYFVRGLLPQPQAKKSSLRREILFSSLETRTPPLLLLGALVFPLLAIIVFGGLQPSRYWVDLGILILTYIMLGWGLNIVVGLAGLLDLGYVAFYAVGAYSYALIATTLIQIPQFESFGPWLFWICLPLAGFFAAFCGILLGFPVLRLRGDYLAIVTLAFGEIIRLVLINWVPVTGGGAGISSIPRPSFFGIPFTSGEEGFAATFGLVFDPMHRMLFLYYLILALAVATFLVTMRLRRLPIGRAWEALREDEIACRALGLNTTTIKLTAFALGAMFGGFAGCFFAARQGFISPESFTFIESAIILAIVVLGGMGSMLGVVLASIALIGGIEMLRHVTFLQAVFGANFDPGQYRMLIFGLLMVTVMILRPRGLMATRQPSALLHDTDGRGHGSTLLSEQRRG
jgi:branched-chain amino acid transport system permease protein